MKIPNAFRLSLRELFLLVLVAGMGLGWWVDHRPYAGLDDFVKLLDAYNYDSPKKPTSDTFTTSVKHNGRWFQVTVLAETPTVLNQ